MLVLGIAPSRTRADPTKAELWLQAVAERMGLRLDFDLQTTLVSSGDGFEPRSSYGLTVPLGGGDDGDLRLRFTAPPSRGSTAITNAAVDEGTEIGAMVFVDLSSLFLGER
ncbi:MAG TPA: hypothetical protein VM734_23625 [Kofleriaceae bacterium]|jgi:hypothetical protein|nr:hypothetical protein [Kofleriaceae bacterium]